MRLKVKGYFIVCPLFKHTIGFYCGKEYFIFFDYYITFFSTDTYNLQKEINFKSKRQRNYMAAKFFLPLWKACEQKWTLYMLKWWYFLARIHLENDRRYCQCWVEPRSLLRHLLTKVIFWGKLYVDFRGKQSPKKTWMNCLKDNIDRKGKNAVMIFDGVVW